MIGIPVLDQYMKTEAILYFAAECDDRKEILVRKISETKLTKAEQKQLMKDLRLI